MKKGRASDVTRPQPTIYGNCDSWEFIVGKKARHHKPFFVAAPPLRCSNASLSTTYQQFPKNNFWTTGMSRERHRNGERACHIVVAKNPFICAKQPVSGSNSIQIHM
jgi:hypothetical protein